MLQCQTVEALLKSYTFLLYLEIVGVNVMSKIPQQYLTQVD